MKPAKEVAREIAEVANDTAWMDGYQYSALEESVLTIVTADRLAVAEKVIEACAVRCDIAQANYEALAVGASTTHQRDRLQARAGACRNDAREVRALDPAKILEEK